MVGSVLSSSWDRRHVCRFAEPSIFAIDPAGRRAAADPSARANKIRLFMKLARAAGSRCTERNARSIYRSW